MCSMATPTASGAQAAVRALLGVPASPRDANPGQWPASGTEPATSGTASRGPPGEGETAPASGGGRCRAGEGEPFATACQVKVMDLREEAVVYIRGQPYVLRDMEQHGGPLKHVGIEGPMVSVPLYWLSPRGPAPEMVQGMWGGACTWASLDRALLHMGLWNLMLLGPNATAHTGDSALETANLHARSMDLCSGTLKPCLLML